MNLMCFESVRSKPALLEVPLMCFENFKSVRTIIRPAPLLDQHYKVVSHEFDVFRKFRISSNH